MPYFFSKMFIMLCLGTKSLSAHGSDGSMNSQMGEGVGEEGGTNPNGGGCNL